jgi:hypothetical protein
VDWFVTWRDASNLKRPSESNDWWRRVSDWTWWRKFRHPEVRRVEAALGKLECLGPPDAWRSSCVREQLWGIGHPVDERPGGDGVFGKTIQRAFLSGISLLYLGTGVVPHAAARVTPTSRALPGGTPTGASLTGSGVSPIPGTRSMGFTERRSPHNPARLFATFSESSGFLELHVVGNGDQLGPTWILIGLGETPGKRGRRLNSGGELLVGPPYRMLSRGAEVHQLPLRDPAGLAGATWSLQAAVWTPDGRVFSIALDITVAGSDSGPRSTRR